jgi:hypothetical protein
VKLSASSRGQRGRKGGHANRQSRESWTPKVLTCGKVQTRIFTIELLQSLFRGILGEVVCGHPIQPKLPPQCAGSNPYRSLSRAHFVRNLFMWTCCHSVGVRSSSRRTALKELCLLSMAPVGLPLISRWASARPDGQIDHHNVE